MTTETEDLVISVTPRNRANFRRLKTNSIQSFKRWEKENELLYAMMEDESEWLAKLFPDVVISPEFFFYALEDGSLLCRLANYIQHRAELYSRRYGVEVPGKKCRYHTMTKSSKEIKLFRSRENVQQFLVWCRSHGLPEAILFESNDVVQVDDYREGCRGVIICLMEIVRRTAKFDLDELPQLIQMEKEIEEDEAIDDDSELSNGQGQVLDVEKLNMTEIDKGLEVHVTDNKEVQSPSSLDSDSGVDSVFDQDEGENSVSRLKEFSQDVSEKTSATSTVGIQKQITTKPKDQRSSPKKDKEPRSLLESKGPKSELDKKVCKMAQDYNIKIVQRLKEGKYIILGRIMFVRMLNDHMLVRIGGGWDTLEHYLMTHAPSKEALESPSTPSCATGTSPRNSLSASSGVRGIVIERTKKKEQIAVTKRDSVVYSSQGSLNQQLGSQCTPKIREKGKRNSLIDKDEKDITEAIRKISTSVSLNLPDRPASFTSKTFHQLRNRFDKGIFCTERRTSSPDLTEKAKKSRRRLSDISMMADVAASLAFVGEQTPIATNNDAGKHSENMEEPVSGREFPLTGGLLEDQAVQGGILPPEHTENADTPPAVMDLSSMESSIKFSRNGGTLDCHLSEGGNVDDEPSPKPLGEGGEQEDQVVNGISSLDKPAHQQISMAVVDNGPVPKEEENLETNAEPLFQDDIENSQKDTGSVCRLQTSPRPIGLGDLLLDSETKESEGTTDDLSDTPASQKESVHCELEAATACVESEEDEHDVEEEKPTQVTLAGNVSKPIGDGHGKPAVMDGLDSVVMNTTSEAAEIDSASPEVLEDLDEMKQTELEEHPVNESLPNGVQGAPVVERDTMEETSLETETESLEQEGKNAEYDQRKNEKAPIHVHEAPKSFVSPTQETVLQAEFELLKLAEKSGEVEQTTEADNRPAVETESFALELSQQKELNDYEQPKENVSTENALSNSTGDNLSETELGFLKGAVESGGIQDTGDVENSLPVEMDSTPEIVAETNIEHLERMQESINYKSTDQEAVVNVQVGHSLSVDSAQETVLAPELLQIKPSIEFDGAEQKTNPENVSIVEEIPPPDPMAVSELQPLNVQEDSTETESEGIDVSKDDAAKSQHGSSVVMYSSPVILNETESKPTDPRQERNGIEELTSTEQTTQELSKVGGEESTCRELLSENTLEPLKSGNQSERIEEENYVEETVKQERKSFEGVDNLVAFEEPGQDEVLVENTKATQPFASGESEHTGAEMRLEVGKSKALENRVSQVADVPVTEKLPLKTMVDGKPKNEPVVISKTEKSANKATKSKPTAASVRPKSPSKVASTVKQASTKKPIEAAKPTLKSAPTKNSVKPAVPKSATSKAPISKPPVRAAEAAKKTTVKSTTTKTDEEKKAGKNKTSEATRPSSKIGGGKPQTTTRMASSPTKKALSSSAHPSAAKTVETIAKKPNARPQSAKPNPSATGTNHRKAVATTTTANKATSEPVKSQSTVKKTREERSSQSKNATTTTTAKKTAAKTSISRPTSAAAKKPAPVGAKQKVSAPPRSGTAGSKPGAKSAQKKIACEKPGEKNNKSEKLPESVVERETTETNEVTVIEKDLKPLVENSIEDTLSQCPPSFSVNNKAIELSQVEVPSEGVIEQQSLSTSDQTSKVTGETHDEEQV
ncbi:microtubule-associated protein futsch-like [Acropora millepora]|uniref:microtubule-associated protein futsch-like n=1 Tax=Acropora millepora TaxID=45264 RepID=UPI001CF5CFF2|nr:microtubule-associated protein futsch-like [Acropora millepora]